MNGKICFLKNQQATELFGQTLSQQVQSPLVIYLNGDLGSGKTTFVRGFLRGLGFNGHVKSPTYNLLESYSFQSFSVLHFDLYRFSHAEEWIDSGFDDLIATNSAIIFIEWPDYGAGYIPQADIMLLFCEYDDISRQCEIVANTEHGEKVVALWSPLIEENF